MESQKSKVESLTYSARLSEAETRAVGQLKEKGERVDPPTPKACTSAKASATLGRRVKSQKSKVKSGKSKVPLRVILYVWLIGHKRDACASYILSGIDRSGTSRTLAPA